MNANHKEAIGKLNATHELKEVCLGNQPTNPTLYQPPNLKLTLMLTLTPTQTSQAELHGKYQEEIGKLHAAHVVREVCSVTQTLTQTKTQTLSQTHTRTQA